MWSRCSLVICNWSPSSFQSVTICAMAPRCLLVSGSADSESRCALVFTTTIGEKHDCDNCSKHCVCVCVCVCTQTVYIIPLSPRVPIIQFLITYANNGSKY